MRALGRDGDLAFCSRQAVSLGSCPAFFPIPASAGGSGEAGRGPGGSQGPPRLGRSPGGLVWGGSGCSRWRQRVCAGREGGVGKGSVQTLALSFGSPAWRARNSACAARPAPAPRFSWPPASGDAGRHLLPWSAQLPCQSTAVSVGKSSLRMPEQDPELGVLCSASGWCRGVLQTMFSASSAWEQVPVLPPRCLGVCVAAAAPRTLFAWMCCLCVPSACVGVGVHTWAPDTHVECGCEWEAGFF